MLNDTIRKHAETFSKQDDAFLDEIFKLPSDQRATEITAYIYMRTMALVSLIHAVCMDYDNATGMTAVVHRTLDAGHESLREIYTKAPFLKETPE